VKKEWAADADDVKDCCIEISGLAAHGLLRPSSCAPGLARQHQACQRR
jgi:hypothetical protein